MTDNPFKRAIKEMPKVHRRRMDHAVPMPRRNPRRKFREHMGEPDDLFRDLAEDEDRHRTWKDRYGVVVGPHSRKYRHGKGI